jgi:dTDP-4-dehydrorhamnose 3,5-epimerase-like enzyme
MYEEAAFRMGFISYDPAGEKTLSWDDPTLNITWPIRPPLCSPKDQRGLLLDAV